MAPVFTASEISYGTGRVKDLMAFFSARIMFLPTVSYGLNAFVRSGADFPGKCFSTY